MEEQGSFGPTVVVAVGLSDDRIEELQDACSARKIRLVTAARIAELPISVHCDHAIVASLLPDGDGRRLASDFVRAGAGVMVVDNTNATSVADVWSIGASLADETLEAGDWLDALAGGEHVEAVSRAGRLMEAQRLADTVEALAAFSGATGVPVSFVRMRADSGGDAALDAALDQLTSVVGMTTVFHDAPGGERMAVVINGDRRRLVRLLDDSKSAARTEMAVVEITSHDSLPAVLGRSRTMFWKKPDPDERSRVLIAVGPGHDKISETLRAALHRMDFTPVFWDAAFRFEDVRANPPVAAVVDGRLSDERASSIIASSLDQDPPIPVIGVSTEEEASVVHGMLNAGAVDFLVWPFSSGEVQAAVARAVTIGSGVVANAVAGRVPESVAPAAPDPQPEEPEIVARTADDAPPVVEEPQETYAPEPEPSLQEEAQPDNPQPAPEEKPAVSTPSFETVLAQVVRRRLAEGDSVNLEGLGVLSVQHETSRIVHDRAGRTIVEPPKRTLTFEPNRSDVEGEGAQ